MAKMWASINAPRVAGQPLTAELQAWYDSSGAAATAKIWAEIDALRVAGQPLTAELQAWYDRTSGNNSNGLFCSWAPQGKKRIALQKKQQALASIAPTRDAPLTDKVAYARTKAGSGRAFCKEADTAIIDAVEAGNIDPQLTRFDWKRVAASSDWLRHLKPGHIGSHWRVLTGC